MDRGASPSPALNLRRSLSGSSGTRTPPPESFSHGEPSSTDDTGSYPHKAFSSDNDANFASNETNLVVPPVASSTLESCIVVLTFIALAVVLYFVQTVLVPLILAIFAASMLVPRQPRFAPCSLASRLLALMPRMYCVGQVPLMDMLTDRPLRVFNHTWCSPWYVQLIQRDAHTHHVCSECMRARYM